MALIPFNYEPGSDDDQSQHECLFLEEMALAAIDYATEHDAALIKAKPWLASPIYFGCLPPLDPLWINTHDFSIRAKIAGRLKHRGYCRLIAPAEFASTGKIIKHAKFEFYGVPNGYLNIAIEEEFQLEAARIMHRMRRDSEIPEMELHIATGVPMTQTEQEKEEFILPYISPDDGDEYAKWWWAGSTPDMRVPPRTARRIKRTTEEVLALHAGLVGGRHAKRTRCTSHAKQCHSTMLVAQDEFLGKLRAYCAETGQVLRLPTTKDKAKRAFAERLAICKGIEILADAWGWRWARVVVTVPGHMHPNPAKAKNSWDGTTPRQAARWLARRWERLRANLAAKGIVLAGFWTREAQGDATPHINFLIVFKDGAEEKTEAEFRRLFGHSERAVDFMMGNQKEEGGASFSSYCFKYFAKFLNDGDDAESQECKEEAAWAWAHGLRRYGFFGIPSLVQWRLVRRQKTKPTDNPILAAAWNAATSGNAAEWIQINGGLACPRKNRPVRTWREIPAGRISAQAVGLLCGLDAIRCRRPGQWTLIAESELTKKEGLTLKGNHPRGADEPPPEPQKPPPPPAINPVYGMKKSDWIQAARKFWTESEVAGRAAALSMSAGGVWQ